MTVLMEESFFQVGDDNAPLALSKGANIQLEARETILDTRIKELQQEIARNCDSGSLAEEFNDIFNINKKLWCMVSIKTCSLSGYE